MYAAVFPDMAAFVRSQGAIPSTLHESEIVDVPKCYYTRWSPEHSVKDDMIIMENLMPRGFAVLEQGRVGEQQEAHVELAVREVAKFHAISYCMKDGSCNYLLNKFPSLGEDRWAPDT